MIDIRELRINSTVLCDGVRAKVVDLQTCHFGSKTAPHVRVKGISPYTGEEKIVGGMTDGNYIDPIPITEELLKELGFENGWQGTFDGYKITIAEQCEFGYSMGAYDVSIKNVMTSSHIATIDGIKHLHELEQFVFMATKQELI